MTSRNVGIEKPERRGSATREQAGQLGVGLDELALDGGQGPTFAFAEH